MSAGRIVTMLLPAACLVLAACGGTADRADEPTSLPTATLAAALADKSELSQFSTLVTDSELGSVFDGRGVYTVLAPVDRAFDGATLSVAGDMGSRALLVAALRRQILPGYVTRDSILSAIEENGGKTRMRTLGNSLVTFTRDGDAIRVETEGGESALLAGDTVTATNGAILPVDSLLAIERDLPGD